MLALKFEKVAMRRFSSFKELWFAASHSMDRLQ